ncbi:alpha-amylase family protein [Pedobacter sp. SYP-B3415]|uniref:alpha-amylase family protein n=1 Tax=Pedobacter sp. SYP-B3415 TaxID=2496641 RepID=UPI00101D5BB7|nr:alpha-amylase family protein [Pedobacter sp. SYP-B3415]
MHYSIHTTGKRILYFALCITLLSGCKQKEHPAGTPVGGLHDPVIYALEIKTFQDSDGDGTGDIRGLINRLGYLNSLGINVIWLAPFQPSPGQDDGYDPSDHYGIDKKFGTPADLQEFLSKAHARKMRVIMDLVLNHTSTEHPWFKAAQRDPQSKFRDWYVFSKTRPEDAEEGMVFPGVQKETWTLDPVSKLYYFHRFYRFQADLNYENPEVVKTAEHIVQYWLKQGMDGFRLDAVPFIIDVPRTGAEDPEHLFPVLDRLVQAAKKVKPDAILLAEANVTAEENQDYFGEQGQRMNVMFNFYANQNLFYAFTRNRVAPFLKAMEKFRQKPPGTEWAYFLRNHDEIDLGRLTNWERNQVYEKFGPAKTMQLYDRGIRRRLSPMLRNPKLIAMSYSLLFSLPGKPVLRYGEEIGMGDDLSLKERLAVRTPMQWNQREHAGFTSADSAVRPVISSGAYNYHKINVKKQLNERTSLLNNIRKMILFRKKYAEFFREEWEGETLGSGKVLILRYKKNGNNLITLHNFSPDSVRVRIPENVDGSEKNGLVYSLPSAKLGSDGRIELSPYGAAWLFTADKKR